jgi:hypothetical protein
MSDTKFSNSELKVQAIARRRANAQLMRVPWSRFRKAYDKYPRWQALALWVQAVIAAEDSVPAWIIDDLRKCCPGFVEHEATSHDPKLMGLHLLEWAHNHEFASAKEEGWLDALTFYGVRHPLSQSAWAYWEHCEEEWGKRSLSSYPNFEEWLAAAAEYRPDRIKGQHQDLCEEEFMRNNDDKATDGLLTTYLSLANDGGTIVRRLRKTPRTDARSKLVVELRSLDRKRMELLDQLDDLLKSHR